MADRPVAHRGDPTPAGDLGDVAASRWRTGRPPDHGYYLGAWRRGEGWAVSELWFNPDSIGTGWWSSRGYLGEDGGRYSTETIPVEAWMPMPEYPGPAPEDGTREH